MKALRFGLLVWLSGIPFLALPGNTLSLPQPQGNLEFTENKGQWEKPVLFKAELNGGAWFAEAGGVTLRFFHPDDWAAWTEHPKQGLAKPPERVRSHAFRIKYPGSRPAAWTGKFRTQGYKNYFIGQDTSRWAAHVLSYKALVRENLYPGIDQQWFESDGHLKYSYYLAPGADPDLIREEFEAAGTLYLENGDLHVKTSVNEVIIHRPVAWQEIQGQRQPVTCYFRLEGNTLQYVFPEGYDPMFPLLIDPTLTFSTYTGSTADNWGFTATYDNAGNLYAGGIAFGTGYPVTLGAVYNSFQGGTGIYPCDISITKFNANGSALIYSTYLGGSRNEIPESMIVNANNELYILGTTASLDYPVSANAFDKTHNGGTQISLTAIDFQGGTDLFITRLNAAGTAVLSSTYVGGGANDGLNHSLVLNHNYADHARGEIMLDAAGNVYVASCTWSSNFPTTSGSFQVNTGGQQDACLFSMPPDLSSLNWSTYLGGSGDDAAYSVKVTPSGTVYAAGGTTSPNFPTTTGSLHTSYLGSPCDGFAVALSNNGSALIAGTYIGTSKYDQTYFIELDSYGFVYLLGQTSGNYPVTSGVYSNPNSGHYITKLNSGLSSIVYSTVFGKGDGNPDISPTAFLVDNCENVYVSGWGGQVNGTIGNTNGLPVTSNAYQSGTDGSDFYFFVLSKDAQSLLYATFFGGPQSPEHVDGGTSRFDKNGIIYQAVCAGCGGFDDFPYTPGAWSANNNSTNCNLGAVKFEFQLNSVEAHAAAQPSSIGCAPYTVNFTSNGSIGLDYFWDFGDGNTSTQANPSYTYNDTGTYAVMLVVLDTVVCNSFDTTYLTVKVVAPPLIQAAGAPLPPDGCAPLLVDFQNSSTPGINYAWNFGDGNTSFMNSPSHLFTAPGNYSIRLVAIDTSICQNHDTTYLSVTVFDDALAAFQASPVYIKPGIPVHFQNQSQNSYAWVWDFGDGSTSTLENPDHTYSQVGVYTVCLWAKNQNGCDDTVCYDLEVYDEPKVYIPTAFSPNGDNLNDEFVVFASGYVRTEFRIYNRWGELVFATDDLSRSWNGIYEGKPQEIGVYAWVFIGTLPDGKEEVYKGNLTLIR